MKFATGWTISAEALCSDPSFCKGQIRFTQILDGFPKILRTGIPEFATLMGIIKYEPTNLKTGRARGS
jgi:hypothetical protein